jgi:hypothetical protein
VLIKFELRVCCPLVSTHVHFARPEHELVIVASTSQLVIVERILQAAHLLLVPSQLTDIITFTSYVSVQNRTIFRPRTQHSIRVPSKGSDSSLMAFKLSH